jgi:dsRNA-specific ribonuclease
MDDNELSQGMGNSKKAAEQRAAEIACQKLNIPDKEE